MFLTAAEFVLRMNEWALEDPYAAKVEKSKARPRRVSFGAARLSEEERLKNTQKMLDHLDKDLNPKKPQ
jgi:hypothetical protein